MTTAEFATRALIVAALVFVLLMLSQSTLIFGRPFDDCMDRMPEFERVKYASFCHEHSTD